MIRRDCPFVSFVTFRARLTFLQPLMRAAASVEGVEKSSLTVSLGSLLPAETTQTVSHMRKTSSRLWLT